MKFLLIDDSDRCLLILRTREGNKGIVLMLLQSLCYLQTPGRVVIIIQIAWAAATRARIRLFFLSSFA